MDSTTAHGVTSGDSSLFLEAVRQSGLVPAGPLDKWIKSAVTSSGIVDTVSRIVADGLLTGYQARQVLAGRGRRLLLKGKYRVLDELGTGGTGTVLLAEHVWMRKRVAVKVLPPRKAADPVTLARFRREAAAVAALDHPNIVHAFDCDDDAGLHFLAMEYVEGMDLHKLVQSRGPLPVRQAVDLVSQAAAGLHHAHQAGWVHRDVKPANLLLETTGRVKVLDLGLARVFAGDGDELTAQHDAGAVMGTVDFIAPEQTLNSSTVDHRADVYSLGATFYFLLAGRAPFPGGTVAQRLIARQLRDPAPVRESRPDVPEEVAAVIQAMMARDPADRYASLADVARDLASGAFRPVAVPSSRADDTASLHRPRQRGRVPSRWGLWPWVGGAVLIAAGLSLAAMTVVGRGTARPPGDETPVGSAPVVPQRLVPPEAPIKDGGFETPSLLPGQSTYHPTGAPWTFGPQSGLAAAGPGFLMKVPQGRQVLMLRHDGIASQGVSLAEGTYHATFFAIQPHPNSQSFRVSLGDHLLGTFTPGKEFGLVTTPSVFVTTGSYTVRLQGLNTRGWDNTGYIDDFQLIKE